MKRVIENQASSPLVSNQVRKSTLPPNSVPSSSSSSNTVQINIHHQFIPKPYCHTKPSSYADILDQQIEEYSKLFNVSFVHPGVVPPDMKVINNVCGRIIVEEGEETEDIFLEASRACASGHRQPLDFSEAKGPISIFPGQICAFTGVIGEFSFKVKSQIKLPVPSPPSITKDLGRPLSLLIAKGPFAIGDEAIGVQFEALLNLAYGKQPQCILFIAPFITEKASINSAPAAFREQFLARIRVLQSRLSDVQIFFVGMDDECYLSDRFIFPCCALGDEMIEGCTNIHLLSNPCCLEINGHLITVSSPDIISSLCEKEKTFNCTHENQLDRISGCLLHNPYPLLPADINLDHNLIPVLDEFPCPNLLISPSALRPFHRKINQTNIVNPGIFSAGTGDTKLGHFCLINYHSKGEEKKGTDFTFEALEI